MLQQVLAQRKHFTHLKRTLDLIATGDLLEQVNTETGRYYKTPTGELYPSVTTVTGMMNAKVIHEWRARVGNEEANRISSQATTRGTRIHQLCEDYLNNDDIDASKYSYNDALNFAELKPELDINIDNIHLQEERLYSDYLKMAGTVDCVAEWKGKLSIIDFKTARKLKNRDHILNYFCQATAYAIMYEERFNIPVSRIVILISVDNEPPQVFEDRRDYYVKQLLEVREQYRKKYNV
jgi:ATP-dependent exoDNAse (exonuclease V) beta subunit